MEEAEHHNSSHVETSHNDLSHVESSHIELSLDETSIESSIWDNYQKFYMKLYFLKDKQTLIKNVKNVS